MKAPFLVMLLATFLFVSCNPAQQSSSPDTDKTASVQAPSNTPEALCTPPEIIHNALVQFGDFMTDKGPGELRSKFRQAPLTGRSVVVDFEEGLPLYFRQYILSFSIPELRSHDKQTGQTICNARFTMTGLTVPSTGTSSVKITYNGMYRMFKSEGKSFIELSIDPTSKNFERIPEFYQQGNSPGSSTGEKPANKS